MNFPEKIKEKFGYGPSTLPAFVNDTADKLIPALVNNSNFLSKVTVDTDVKNKKTVKLVDVIFELSKITGCDTTDEGAVNFTEVILETVLVGWKSLLCNQDLDSTWTALLLKQGATEQMKELPAAEQLKALLTMYLKDNVEELIMNGDTGSLVPKLQLLDGLKVKFKNDVTMPAFGNIGAVTASNAVQIFKGVYRKISSKVFDNNVNIEINCSRVDFFHLVDNLETLNSYSYSATIQGEGNELSLIIPNTTIKVVVNRFLSTGEIYAIPYQYIVVGTDASADLEGIDVKYLDEAERLRIKAAMYLGVNYAYGKYFAKYDEISS